jgi:APA family basic amino acid/polyamine antiporter
VAVGGFEDVSGWFVTTSWLFYGLTVAGVFILRRKEAAAGREPEASYRTWLYPLTPILFILVTLAIIGSDLASSTWRAAAGVVIALLGLPIYHFWFGRRRQGA